MASLRHGRLSPVSLPTTSGLARTTQPPAASSRPASRPARGVATRVSAHPTCLKEWAPVVEAVGRGMQTVRLIFLLVVRASTCSAASLAQLLPSYIYPGAPPKGRHPGTLLQGKSRRSVSTLSNRVPHGQGPAPASSGRGARSGVGDGHGVDIDSSGLYDSLIECAALSFLDFSFMCLTGTVIRSQERARHRSGRGRGGDRGLDHGRCRRARGLERAARLGARVSGHPSQVAAARPHHRPGAPGVQVGCGGSLNAACWMCRE